MGLFGYQPSIILDMILVICLGLVPLLKLGIRFARQKKISVHRNYMTAVSVSVGILLTWFEWDLRMKGGIKGLAEIAGRSAHVSAHTYQYLLITHLFLAISCFLFWLCFVVGSWIYYPKILKEPSVKARHAFLANILMKIIYAVLVTGYLVYYFAFIH